MANTDDDHAAGAKAPAAAGSGTWVDWRERADRPIYHVVLWPNRSLDRGGKRTVMLLTALGLAVPCLAFAGTPVFWGLLPFCAVALGFLAWGFRRNDFDGLLAEELTIWRDEVRVERREPRGRVFRWQAVPHWVRVELYEEGQKVENYLTLRGGGREIELGAFLSPDERLALREEVMTALARAR